MPDQIADTTEAIAARLMSLELDSDDAADVVAKAVEAELRFIRNPPPGPLSEGWDENRADAYRHVLAVRRAVANGGPVADLLKAFVAGGPWPPTS